MESNRIIRTPARSERGGHNPNNMKEILTVKTFNVDVDGLRAVENLKSFEEAEAFIIAHDKKEHADWLLSSYQDPERAKEFEHHRYIIYHDEGKVTVDDVFAKTSFEELCDEAFGWRAISVVEFKF